VPNDDDDDMRGGLKFKCEAPKWNASNRIVLNWNMWSQTKMCIVKLSCVDKRENGA
jgi:hypothetical protein